VYYNVGRVQRKQKEYTHFELANPAATK